MAQIYTQQPSKVYRGTVDEVFSHRSEIPTDATVELQIFESEAAGETATMALMRSWLEEDATNDPAEQQAAQQELNEFKRRMNQPRKEVGARPHYPEAE